MRTLTFNRIIGAGAMGTVYHAELRVPRGFRRTCAVKVLKSQGPDHEHFRARMRDEARLLGMLQDELILGVSELAVVEGRDAVVMDYVEGADLDEILKLGPLSPRALAELGAEVAGTLGRAHTARHPQTGQSLRVIHRDIKPANIMITSRGGVRVLDFGVARAAFGSRESQTQGLVLGTLNYFPPEILAGQEPTPAVDLYGLGLTLWECATAKDWGAPRVQRSQFERRVDRRMEELPAGCRPLEPVLRQVLQWDPLLRPDGNAVERMLLSAAEKCAGTSLRSWGREVVPTVLEGRKVKIQADPLLGRTIEIRSEPTGPQPLETGIEPPEDRPVHAYESYNDIGPSAAVVREPMQPIDPPTDAPPPTESTSMAAPRPKAKKKRRGLPLLAMILVGVALGGTLGVVILIALAVLAVALS